MICRRIVPLLALTAVRERERDSRWYFNPEVNVVVTSPRTVTVWDALPGQSYDGVR